MGPGPWPVQLTSGKRAAGEPCGTTEHHSGLFAQSGREYPMDNNLRASKANRITVIGAIANMLLLAAKFTTGILGRSQAMVADAVHTLTDFATDIIVFVGIFFAKKPRDLDHPYGHGKVETIAAVLIGFALASVGIKIGVDGATTIKAVIFDGLVLPAPHWIAFAAALVSVLLKEWLYRITAKVGREIDSPAIIANAWHHRSDALSSIGTTVGIGGAVFLGSAWSILDPIAALVVSFFILKAAWDVTRHAFGDLIDTALPMERQTTILELAAGIPGISDPHNLRTRKVGPVVVAELHVRVNPDLTVGEGHELASRVEARLREELGADSIVTVHVEPLGKESPV